MSKVIAVRVEDQLAAWLERRAAQLGIPPGQLLREHLEQAKAAGTVLHSAIAEKKTGPVKTAKRAK